MKSVIETYTGTASERESVTLGGGVGGAVAVVVGVGVGVPPGAAGGPGGGAQPVPRLHCRALRQARFVCRESASIRHVYLRLVGNEL